MVKPCVHVAYKAVFIIWEIALANAYNQKVIVTGRSSGIQNLFLNKLTMPAMLHCDNFMFIRNCACN